MPGLSDLERTRVESERRYVLRLLNYSADVGTSEGLILRGLQAERYPTLPHDIRRYLDYLEKKGLIRIEDREANSWYAFITSLGIDVVEGTVKAPPGIAKW